MTGVFVIVAMSLPLWARPHSSENKELFKQADLVIRGEVEDIKCVPGGYEQDRCRTVTGYDAIVVVNTVKKGRWPGRTIPVRFRDVQFVHGCTGDADPVSRIGEHAFYYLVSRGDGAWAPIDRNAVVVKWPGEGPLPACR